MLKVPGLAPLAGLARGATWDKVLGAVVPSMFPGGLLPPGEMEYKGLKQEYGLAWEAYERGNKKAISDFFDEHPEYQARLALRRDPQERLTQFLKSEIWDAYTTLGPTDRKQAAAYMGTDFQDFLDSDSGVEFSVDQLALWAKMLKGMVPETPKTKPIIEGQTPGIAYYSPEVTQITDQYFTERKEKFPRYYALQSTYYSLPKAKRKQFLLRFPELQSYFDWSKKWKDDYPELKPLFSGEVFRRVDTSSWPATLEYMVQLSALTGDELPSGAQSLMMQIWEEEGRPYDNFETWLETQVYPSMTNQMQQEMIQ